MSSRAGPAVDAVEVRKSFDRGKVRALEGLTLRVDPGELVAITGPSGCGKSTFLHVVAGLDRIDSGRLEVFGHDLRHGRGANGYRRSTVGVVFQLHNLLPHLDAVRNVEVAMLGTHLAAKEQRRRALDLLTQLDLEGLEHRRPPELSGGERQRVAIARALANRPRLLLADEPTGSLDPASVGLVVDLLDRLRREESLTVVMVTHDPVVAARSDRVLHLEAGRLSETAVVNQLAGKRLAQG